MGQQRDQVIELGRILAAFGIVAFHTKVPHAPVYYGGLIYFMFLSPYLEGRYNWARVRAPGRMVRGFLLPWAFWMAVYGALNLLAGNPLFPEAGVVGKVLGGTSLHLWFMPAMCLFLLGLGVVKRHVPPAAAFWSSLVAGTAMLAAFPLTGAGIVALGAPWYQWLHALPAALLGLAFGLQGGDPLRCLAAWGWTLAALVLAALSDLSAYAVTYPVGMATALLLIELWPRLEWPRLNVQGLASCTMGVYLSHIAFVRVLGAVLGQGRLTTALTAFAAALLTVWLARRYLPRSRLVLG